MYRHITQTLLVAAASVACLSPTANAQGFYGFSRILKGPSQSNRYTSIQPKRFEADTRGGMIQVSMPDTAGTCYGEYVFQWKFIDDVSRLVPAQKYRFQMTGRRIGGSCEKNTNTAWMKSSNMGAALAERAGIQSLANAVVVKKTQPSVTAHPAGPRSSTTGTVELTQGTNPDETYFTFQFDFSSFPYAYNSKSCSFEVVYVYRKNVPASVARTTMPMSRAGITGTYSSPEGRVFRITQNGNSITAVCDVSGVGRTTITAHYSAWTVADVLGKITERQGFAGTFVTRLNSGPTIRGRTQIVPASQPGVLEISSVFERDGEPVTGICSVTRMSN